MVTFQHNKTRGEHLSIRPGEPVIEVAHPDEVFKAHEASIGAPLPQASPTLNDLAADLYAPSASSLMQIVLLPYRGCHSGESCKRAASMT